MGGAVRGVIEALKCDGKASDAGGMEGVDLWRRALNGQWDVKWLLRCIKKGQPDVKWRRKNINGHCSGNKGWRGSVRGRRINLKGIGLQWRDIQGWWEDVRGWQRGVKGWRACVKRGQRRRKAAKEWWEGFKGWQEGARGRRHWSALRKS